MDNDKQKKWFIILNKSPRGPFLEREIKELVQQGLVRHNDLALLIEDDVQGTWKFLWQYPEFDSRLNATSPPPPDILEKRKPRTQEEIQKDLEQEIPLDLKAISLEDLIIRAKPRAKREVDFSDSGSDQLKQVPSQSSTTRWMRLTPLFLFLVAITGMIVTQTSVVKPLKIDKVMPPRVVASEIKKQPPKPRKIIGAPKKKPGITVPQERDRGEVREEELLRLRQAEKLRELEERAKQERQKELERTDDNDENEEDERQGRSQEEGSGEDSELDEEDEYSEEDLETDAKAKRGTKKKKKGRDQESLGDEEEPSWWLED